MFSPDIGKLFSSPASVFKNQLKTAFRDLTSAKHNAQVQVTRAINSPELSQIIYIIL